MKLKLKRNHPNNKFRLGSHVITRMVQDFDLSKEELAELNTTGPKHWIEVVEEKEVKKAKKKKKEEDKK